MKERCYPKQSYAADRSAEDIGEIAGKFNWRWGRPRVVRVRIIRQITFPLSNEDDYRCS